ncbi:hypothetical protein HMPREF9103_02935 [Lentilactobacillus parafarraginis F0439]|uniref:Uncharacterized protein n=1 Tax=Lentilactobacillus parafarraginis F0439 TaxID=797515 RepID=G9ZT63_9LACO|nr:hypothetical protein HMPREF9103_02935 [Lentilactobacillus parafarraginis F0439]
MNLSGTIPSSQRGVITFDDYLMMDLLSVIMTGLMVIIKGEQWKRFIEKKEVSWVFKK